MPFYSVPDSNMSLKSRPSFNIGTAQNSLIPLGITPIETGTSLNHPRFVIPEPLAFFPDLAAENSPSNPHTMDVMNSSSSALNEGLWSGTSLPEQSDMSYTSLANTNIEMSAPRHDFAPQSGHFEILDGQHLQRPSKAKHTCKFLYCSDTFSSEDSFRSHIREFHESRAFLTCLHCQAENEKRTFTLEKRFKEHHDKCHPTCTTKFGPGGLPTCVKRDHLPRKTFFGCWFCVAGFKSLELYMKHLYRKHSDPHAWDASPSHNMVIRSLLTRSGVAEIWQAITAGQTLDSWPKSDITELIQDLEVCRTDKPGKNSANVAEQLAWRAMRLAIKPDTTFRDDNACDWSQPIANASQPNLCLPNTLLRKKRSKRLRKLFLGPLSVDEHNAIIHRLEKNELISK